MIFKEACNVSSRLRSLLSTLRSVSCSAKSIIGEIEDAMNGKSPEDVSLKSFDVYVVSFVEYGDSVDGKPRVLGLFRTMEEASSNMALAAQTYAESLGVSVNYVIKDSASVGDTGECGCEYRIDKMKVPGTGGSDGKDK